MPVIPARKGFGPGKAGWSGWRDKVGMTIRPGPNVFVIVAHAAWGGVPAGRIPARLFRSFHYPGDRLGKYRLDVARLFVELPRMFFALRSEPCL